jgi:hypothetical protein
MQEVYSVKAEQNVRVVGIVRELLPENRLVIEVKNPFQSGEILNILPKKRGLAPYDFPVGEITDLTGHQLPRAITNRLVIINGTDQFRMGDILRRIIAKNKDVDS